MQFRGQRVAAEDLMEETHKARVLPGEFQELDPKRMKCRLKGTELLKFRSEKGQKSK